MLLSSWEKEVLQQFFIIESLTLFVMEGESKIS
jgi:hypothetical protein